METDTNKGDYKSLVSSKGIKAETSQDYQSISKTSHSRKSDDNLNLKNNQNIIRERDLTIKDLNIKDVENPEKTEQQLSYTEKRKLKKQEKTAEKNWKLLADDNWINKNGHNLTFIGIFIFTFLVLFRPYELIPGLGFLGGTPFFVAFATLLVYIPTQLSAEGSVTVLTTEVKCVLVLIALSLLTMPIARDFGLAWETFNDKFIKSVLMFIVMVNVIRTRKRLMWILWLSIGISIYLCYMAISLYLEGQFEVEGYRVAVDVRGMFANPNDMAIHFVTMLPITFCLAVAAKNKVLKIFYFLITAGQVVGVLVTFSRGGFLGLLGLSLVLMWKIGREHRTKAILISAFLLILLVVFAPGNYGVRMLSIFFPGLDPVGSADQRKENLILSIIATIRNPWGIGIGNSITFGVGNLQTHNAYTQVSSELGVVGLAAYLTFMISPFRKLGAIERTLFEKGDKKWFYYLAIGWQASIVGFMISSFFGSIAYDWFVYYLIAYAVTFRRIYQVSEQVGEQS